LRDYSQALDVGGLSKLPKDTIRTLLWILSFLTFGFATGEFEVTEEKLGVYRPEEHIDNPKACYNLTRGDRVLANDEIGLCR
jgi:hypothetical protein